MIWLYIAMGALYVVVLVATFFFLKNADDRQEDEDE